MCEGSLTSLLSQCTSLISAEYSLVIVTAAVKSLRPAYRVFYFSCTFVHRRHNIHISHGRSDPLTLVAKKHSRFCGMEVSQELAEKAAYGEVLESDGELRGY